MLKECFVLMNTVTVDIIAVYFDKNDAEKMYKELTEKCTLFNYKIYPSITVVSE